MKKILLIIMGIVFCSIHLYSLDIEVTPSCASMATGSITLNLYIGANLPNGETDEIYDFCLCANPNNNPSMSCNSTNSIYCGDTESLTSYTAVFDNLPSGIYALELLSRNHCGYAKETDILVPVADDCTDVDVSPACDNGQQDSNETGIDCGGVCPPCENTPDPSPEPTPPTTSCSSRLSAHPNPFFTELTVDFKLAKSTKIELELVSLYGKERIDLIQGTTIETLRLMRECDAVFFPHGPIAIPAEIPIFIPSPHTLPCNSKNCSFFPAGLFRVEVPNLNRLQPGVYVLRLVTSYDVKTLNVVKLR